MKNKSLNSNRLILTLLFMISLAAVSLYGANYVNANGRAIKHGYFYNGVLNSTGNRVLDGGVPGRINTKAEFIAFIKDLRSNGTARDKIGAKYIIQTMRGPDASGNWDHNFPNDADITDWERKINNTEVTVNWNRSYSAAVNTRSDPSSPYDVSKYNDSGSDPSIIFYKGSTILYVVKKACGNPLGNLEGLPEAVSWSITPDAVVKSIKQGTANRTVALPGYKITWTHSVKNEGPSSTNKVLGYDYENNAALGGGDKNPNITVPSGLLSGHVNSSADSYSQYVVQDSDVGSNLCRRTRSWPKTQSTDGVEYSAYACKTVPYSYTLTPSVNVGVEAVEPGSTFNVVPVVSNSGPTRSRATEWQLTKMIVSPNKTYPGAGFTAANRPPCGSYYVASGVTCSTVKTGSSSVFSVNGSVLSGDVLGNYGATVDDLEAGSKLCFALSVKPFANYNDGWSHSAPQCRIVGKHPKVQITGGDLSVGRQFSGIDSALPLANVTTSTTKKDPNTFGSWVEYAIFATGTIRGTASGAAFADPGLVNATACSASKLSFANVPLVGAVCTGAGGTIGGYASARNIPDIAASFPGSGSTISGTVAPSSLNGIYSADDLVLSQSELAPGKTVVLKVKGTVTIAGNQTYNLDNAGGEYKSILELPQLIIIANKIVINSNVDIVDAWLMAKGADGIIETCEIEAKTISDCSTTLTVNGPVMAQKLYLRRTGGSGSGSASGAPAEVFNLRADAYLWAIGRASGSARVYTVNTTELPPRF